MSQYVTLQDPNPDPNPAVATGHSLWPHEKAMHNIRRVVKNQMADQCIYVFACVIYVQLAHYDLSSFFA